MPTSASASVDAIWVNERGNVEMTKETFMHREKDLLRLEAKVQVLEDALAEERAACDDYIARMKELEQILNEQAKLQKRLDEAAKVKWGLLGFVIGGAVVALVD